MPETKMIIGKIKAIYRERYDPDKEYMFMDKVVHDGHLFQSRKNKPGGIDSSDWLRISEETIQPQAAWDGTKLSFVWPDNSRTTPLDVRGPKGPDGEQGNKGLTGHSPELTSDYEKNKDPDVLFSALGGHNLYEVIRKKSSDAILLSVPTLNIGDKFSNLVPASFSASAVSYLDNVKIEKFLLSIPALDIYDMEFDARNNAANLAFQIPENVEIGTEIDIEVKAVDEYGNSSPIAISRATIVAAYVLTPELTSPEEGAELPSVNLSLSASDFGSFGIDDTHLASQWNVARQDTQEIIYDSGESTDLLSHTIESLGTIDETAQYEIRVRFKGETLGWSAWSSPVTVKLLNAYIKKPIIVNPANGATLACNGTLTVATSEFEVIGGEDAHKNTDWKMTSDEEGLNIVAEANDSTDLISHTFTGLQLPTENSFYLFARHKGEKIFKSEWSDVSTFKTSAGVTTYGGRLLYRHSSDMGTVMVCNDHGVTRHILVLDARYRAAKVWAASAVTPSSLTQYDLNNSLGNGCINGSNQSNALPNLSDGTTTDSYLNNIWASNHDARTSKNNCDIWLSAGGSNMTAISYARSVTVNGVGCDIPNMQIAFRISCDSKFLNEMDPTAAQYPSMAFDIGSSKDPMAIGGEDGSFTSTRYTGSNMICTRINSVWYYYPSSSQGVIPILEVAA